MAVVMPRARLATAASSSCCPDCSAGSEACAAAGVARSTETVCDGGSKMTRSGSPRGGIRATRDDGHLPEWPRRRALRASHYRSSSLGALGPSSKRRIFGSPERDARMQRMPRLACWSCGRQIYTVSPLEALFAEERRCPRCGAFLSRERREDERRGTIRRQEPDGDPEPPADERRTGERRVTQRRRSSTGGHRSRMSGGGGWVD